MRLAGGLLVALFLSRPAMADGDASVTTNALAVLFDTYGVRYEQSGASGRESYVVGLSVVAAEIGTASVRGVGGGVGFNLYRGQEAPAGLHLGVWGGAGLARVVEARETVVAFQVAGLVGYNAILGPGFTVGPALGVGYVVLLGSDGRTTESLSGFEPQLALNVGWSW